jgi:CheY-like chemotaxis protein
MTCGVRVTGELPSRVAPPPSEEVQVDVSPDGRVILVAERDRRVRELQEFFLHRAGFSVEFADDGEAAFDRAVALRPSLVVTEILLPRLDGLSLCRRLGENLATRDIPVVVFSILSAGDRAKDAGARAFLRKPLIESVFVSAIQELIAAPTAKEYPWASR